MSSKQTGNKQNQANDETKRPRNVSIKRFVITYIILMNIFFFFYLYKPIHETINIRDGYNRFIVVVTSAMLTALGLPCHYQGSFLMLPDLSLEVRFGCNGLEAVLIYAIAVLSYPASWKKKLVGVAAGFIIIQVANVLRMMLLVYVGLHMRRLFDYIHVYIAQGIMIALALGVFFIYLNYANAPQKAYT